MVGVRKKSICLLLVLLLLGMLVVVMPAPVYAASSSFSLTGQTYPTTLSKGQSFGVTGTVKSAVTLDRVTVGVYSEDAGKWVSTATHRVDDLGAKSYNIKNADPYIKFGTLDAGSYTYRVWVKDRNGTSKYLLKKPFTVKGSGSSSGSSLFSVTGANYPSSLVKGKSFSIKGTVKSKYTISRVTIGVFNEKSGKWMSGAVRRVTGVGAKSYSISKADPYIKFGTLPAGSYTYRVWVKDVKGNTRYVLKKAFKVTSKSAGSGDSNEEPALFSISGAKSPGTLQKGSSFSVKGTVKSRYNISRVTVGVYNEVSGKWMDKAVYRKYKVGAKTFSLSKADAYVKFGSLPAGRYTYRVWVRDVKGNKKYLLKKQFYVTTASSFSASGVAEPGTLAEGSSFSLTGTVKSANIITVIRVGITDADGKWVQDANVKRNPGTKTYKLANVDAYIKFGSLPAGSYHLCVKATDAAGKTKRVVNKAFTVAAKPKAAAPAAVSLPYDAALIKKIGKQPYSGPCGIYSMAYARAVIDGKFPLEGYSSYEDKIISVYGEGGSYAYWHKAGGTMIMFSSVRSLYRKAFDKLAEGMPCIMNCYNPETGNNHFVLVIGYVKGTTRDNATLESFIVLDPATGTKRNMADTGYESPAKSPYGPELVVF